MEYQEHCKSVSVMFATICHPPLDINTKVITACVMDADREDSTWACYTWPSACLDGRETNSPTSLGNTKTAYSNMGRDILCDVAELRLK